jgi:orotate phosphoribosyltransferase
MTLDFLSLVSGRRGHFRLESGHHGALWLDLDGLFTTPTQISPLVQVLATRLAPYHADAICGPLQGGAFLAQLVAQALGAEFWFTVPVRPRIEDGLYRVRYILPAAISGRARGKRVAMVDDVMSAGSALRGTFDELRSHGAEPQVAAALLLLGTKGVEYFGAAGVPVEAVQREPYQLWEPDACELCRAGIELETC